MSGEEIRPGYKRTEVGVIPEDWGVHLLEDICKRITTGKLDANAMVKDGIYPFFTCARERYWINNYAFDDEALLVSGNGANVGHIHYYNGKFNAYQRTYVLTGFTADIQFSKLFMEKSLHARLRTEVNAGNTPYIVMDTLAKMSIPIPPTLHEQRSIATALSDVDALLTKLDQLIAKKRYLKQAAMQQLLTGQTRLPGFSGEWEVKRLGDVAILKNGYTFKSDTYTESGKYRIVTIANVQDGWMRIDGCSLVSELPSDLQPHQHLRVGDILLSMTGNVGRVCRVNEPNFLLNQRVGKVVAQNIDSDFLYVTLSSLNFQRAMTDVAKGGAQPNLSSSDILEYAISIPEDQKEQKAVAAVLCDMSTEVAALEAHRDKARALKQGMMQELLTGRIRLV